MGDRLTSPIVQTARPIAALKFRNDLDGDSWLANEISDDHEWPKLDGYQQKQTKDKLISSKQAAPHNANNNQNCNSQQTTSNNNPSTKTATTTTTPIKLTPRLPRGVSKIPHQVAVNDNNYSNATINCKNYGDQIKGSQSGVTMSPKQQFLVPQESREEKLFETHCNMSSSCKYLTFNKDQATSHFKSLKEELFSSSSSAVSRNNHISGAGSSSNNYTAKNSCPRECGQTEIRTDNKSNFPSRLQESPAIVQPTINQSNNEFQSSNNNSSPLGPKLPPKPLERFNQSKSQKHIVESFREFIDSGHRFNRDDSYSNYERRKQQQQLQSQSTGQPICEAFIMTGQSMMKLSCNESEIKNNPSHNKETKQRDTDPRVKSELSLNKLNGNEDKRNANRMSACPTPEQPVHYSSSRANEAVSFVNNNNSSKLREVYAKKEEQDGHDKGIINSEPELESRTNSREKTFAGASVVPGTTAAATGVEQTFYFSDSNNKAPLIEERMNSNKIVAEANSRGADGGSGIIGGGNCNIRQTATDSMSTLNKTTTTPLTPAAAITAAPIMNSGQRIETDDAPATLMKNSPNSSVNKSNEFPSESLKVKLPANSYQEQPMEERSMTAAALAIKMNGKVEENGASARTGDQQLVSSTQEPPPSPGICNDRDSARRLAKRLYNLSGFKKSDVCHHLSKNNPFSQTVAEEYLKLFDFRSMKLDSALRKFLSKLQLQGETQERERLLSQFSQRFYDCNKEKFPSADHVQTLVCALILLNTDLHGGFHNKKKTKRTKLSLGAFIDGLNNSFGDSLAMQTDCDKCDSPSADSSSSRLNGQLGGSNGALSANKQAYTFPRHLLVDLYESIKKRPLKCGEDKCDLSSFEAELDKIYHQQQLAYNRNKSNTLPTRRGFGGSLASNSSTALSANSRGRIGSKQGLNARLNDDFETAIEFKSGYLNKKRIFEANGKPTGKGRRGWKRVHVSLKDLRLMMRPGLVDSGDDPLKPQQQLEEGKLQSKKSRFQLLSRDLKNTTKIYHSFAKRSTSYTKREFVFHLRLADQSEFLLQANNEQDLISWIDTINFASACLSSPAQPSATKNHDRKSQLRQSISTASARSLLPLSYTRLSYWEQLINHEEKLQRLKVELDDHLSEASNTRNANKRFKSEFIEKIAFLKQEIERYTVYVDLMRKKSNSPEAIVLSKHPQIASLTPSAEMNSSSSALNTKTATIEEKAL